MYIPYIIGGAVGLAILGGNAAGYLLAKDAIQNGIRTPREMRKITDDCMREMSWLLRACGYAIMRPGIRLGTRVYER